MREPPCNLTLSTRWTGNQVSHQRTNLTLRYKMDLTLRYEMNR